MSLSQVQTIGEPRIRTWDDYEQGCLRTFHAGLDRPDNIKLFQNGMSTVFCLLKNELPPLEELMAAWDTQQYEAQQKIDRNV